MPLISFRRLVGAGSLLLVASSMVLAPLPRAQAGAEPGSPPAPNAWGADTIGVLAAPGDSVDHIGIVWDEIIDPASLPDASDFAVTVNDGAAPVVPTDVSLLYSGFAGFLGSAGGVSFMRLDLGFTWTAGVDHLALSYTPGPNPIRDFALNETLPFSGLAVEPWDFGELFTIGPIVDDHHARNRLLLGITLPIDPTSIPAATDFIVEAGGQSIDVLAVTQLQPDSGMGILDLQLASAIEDPSLAVTLDYVPGVNPIRSLRDGTLLDGFSDVAVELLLTSDSVSGHVTAGNTLSTATTDGPTVADPLATSVTTPGGGEVAISEGPVTAASTSGYQFFGQQVEITAPAASSEAPLVIRFDIDASLVPAGQDASTIEILRDGVPVPDCTGSPGMAEPSPCIASRTTLTDGDVSITVLTAQASTWNLAVGIPFDFGGFEPPVTGEAPNLATAGSAVPVKFSLGGFRGLDILPTGAPSTHSVSCDTLAAAEVVEETVAAGASSLSYDEATDLYTYVWKTDRLWRDSCRKLILDFSDGSRQVAVFDFRR